MSSASTPRIGFFGTPEIAVTSLDALARADLTPTCIITNPDRPQGRNMVTTPSPVAAWANERSIDLFKPTSLKDPEFTETLGATEWDLFVVVAYGGILPRTFLEMPKHGVLNMHPSLLPKLRGPSPIRSAILRDMRTTGVTIMQMDEHMDHGPIVAQETVEIDPDTWPIRGRKLDAMLAERGGNLLAETIPAWIRGDITPTPQDHDAATYTTKLTKDMGELTLDPYALPIGADAYQALCTIRAFDGWPGTYFFHNGKRIKIVDAELTSDGTLSITRIIPEGKQEMDFTSYFPPRT